MLARLACALCLLLSAAGLSQTPQAAPPAPPQIRTSAELVVVDVVVQDAYGKPVHNLPRESFRVTENKEPQTLTAFEEHSAANPPKPGPALPPMPPGIFTDYTPVPPSGALNVLLIDALNTPLPDQSYLRNQLKEYVNKAQPGARVAIFGLNTRLFLLQGFTSDPETLKDAVNHKLIPRASNLMDDPMTGAPDTSMSDAASDAGLDTIATNLQQFEAVEQSFKTQLRIQYTLDAFNALAHYLSNFPGRKNLLWFSGSFPIDIMPDASLENPFSVMQVNDTEFRDTTSLLTHSQVAVYPIDARGLMVQPAFNAQNSGRGYARNPGAFSKALSDFSQSQAQEHQTMEQMASDTGGRAFYNTNGLAEAAANALEAGSNYYTLAYVPTTRNPHGEYRSIHMDITGPLSAAGPKLYYRHGYYAALAASGKPTEPAPATAPAAVPATDAKTPSSPTTSSPPLTGSAAEAAAYTRAAMFHGAPTPQDILFKVRVLPVSTTTDAALSPGEQPDPEHPFKGPYRRYSVDFAALGSDIRLAPQPGGNHTGKVDFEAFVYDSDGKLLNIAVRGVQLNLTPENYSRFVKSGLGMHLEVSAPAHGESYLRIAVHDIPSNRYGVVEIPTIPVSRLAPAPPPAPPPAAATPPAAEPKPQQ